MRQICILATFFLAVHVYAVSPQFWKIDTAEEMLKGEMEGLAVTSRGALRAGPTLTRLASVPDPFVLSQTSDPEGTLYIGTGNAGKVYRAKGHEARELYVAPEPEVYALAFTNGSLFVGTSPNGKVYRVDPATGRGVVFFDPKEAYIWAIVPLADGTLAIGTGIEGRLYRVTAKGEGKVWFDSDETHIRSLAVAGAGRLLAGGAGQGRIYEIGEDGHARALFDSQYGEISAIHYDPSTRTAWAAGVTNVLPSTAPAKKETSKEKSAASGKADAKEEKANEASPSSGVDIAFSFGDSGTAPTAAAGNSELYRVDPDGYVEVVREFEKEIIYSLVDRQKGALLVGTGPQGRIYEIDHGEIALVAVLPEKQVMSLRRSGSSLTATTTNSGALYRFDTSPPDKAEFRSPVKDTFRFSRFGQFRLDGESLRKAETSVTFRSGNTSTPDATWSSWSPPVSSASGPIGAPPARYLQWRVSAVRPSDDFRIDSLSASYANRNVAPSIESIVVNEPAVVYIAGSYPAAPQVVEASNPDEFGIFTSLGEVTDRNVAGKKYFRHGYRTVSWKASDANGDDMRFKLEFRPIGSSKWLRLRERISDFQLNFDTSQLPDGRYELRLTASDEPSNPVDPLADRKSGIEMVVDNTSPSISSSVDGEKLRVRVSDRLSPVLKAEYSVDAEKWLPLTPDDGISDSPDESYSIDLANVAGRFVVVRALDSFYNVATASASIPGR